ncbi:MAG TPA: hypothetical protein VG345_13105 [Bryobacteraceae bacterium]|nr:hypothetical protein [Bryobacteraceae bacterium]
MFHRSLKAALGMVALTALAVGTAWAQAAGAQAAGGQAAAAGQPQWKDQGEFDVATAAQKATDPQKKIDALKQWEQKYPDSAYKNQRLLMQAQAYDQLALAAYGKTDPAVLDSGQQAAQTLMDNLDNYFAPSVKPASVSDQQWTAAKKTMQIQGLSVLGYVAMMKKDDPTAEKDFKALLQVDPNNAQASYWLGSVIMRQRKVERYPEGLYEIARAISVTGPTALNAQAKAAAQDYLKKAYTGYHGDATGLDQLMQQASASALPPDGFHIDSVTDVQNKQFANAAEFKKAHPDVALWREIRDALKAANGDTYFQQMKGSEIPPEKDTDGNPIGMFNAKVVSVNGKELVANVDNAGGDATLKFEHPLNTKVIQTGAAFKFKGVAESFVKDPYMLTLTIDDPKTEIDGLPAGSFSAAPSTRRPVRRKK